MPEYLSKQQSMATQVHLGQQYSAQHVQKSEPTVTDVGYHTFADMYTVSGQHDVQAFEPSCEVANNKGFLQTSSGNPKHRPAKIHAECVE